MKVRLTKLVEKCGLLSDRQYGFREIRWTTDAIQTLVRSTNNSVDKNYSTAVVFFTVAKAFDIVNQTKLIDVWENFTIRGVPLKLFRNYLQGRKPIVKIIAEQSSETFLEYGVPQGSLQDQLVFTCILTKCSYLKHAVQW